MKLTRDTSWHKVGKWDNTYYNDHVVVPGVLRLLKLQQNSSVLDVGCGPAAIAQKIPRDIFYTGIDSSESFIFQAKKMDRNPHHEFFVGDATQPLPVLKKYTHATIILALQNIEQPELAIQNTADHLVSGGKLVIVLNHPAFRIPRQSSWGIDEQSKLQYRRENIYMSPLKIPITMHPGSGGGLTWSFHNPLSFYTKILSDNHFVIENIEEWTSDKESVGSAGKMENRARSEFPLFFAIAARFKI